MKKVVLYRYLGTNGTITSPVHLEDVYYTRLMKLTADPGKRLTDGAQTVGEILIPEDEVNLWTEINWVPLNNK